MNLIAKSCGDHRALRHSAVRQRERLAALADGFNRGQIQQILFAPVRMPIMLVGEYAHSLRALVDINPIHTPFHR